MIVVTELNLKRVGLQGLIPIGDKRTIEAAVV